MDNNIFHGKAFEKQLLSFINISLYHTELCNIPLTGINRPLCIGGRVWQCNIQGRQTGHLLLKVEREYPGQLKVSLSGSIFLLTPAKLFTVIYLRNNRTMEREKTQVRVTEQMFSYLPQSWNIDIDPDATYKVRINVCRFEPLNWHTMQMIVLNELKADVLCREMFTQQQVSLLELRARAFGQKMMRPITRFYRNKPKTYFQEISNNNGIMEPYIKDMNGDPKCPINGRINGLFFMGRLDRNNPLCLPPVSPFGDTRFIVPVERLFNAGSRLYFSDFWCHNVEHYVSLVITVPNSEADRFCQTHLLELDKYNNSYLRLDRCGQVYILDTVWVEVLYTEAIGLFEGTITRTGTIGRGQSTRLGMPKKRTCRVCNLYM